MLHEIMIPSSGVSHQCGRCFWGFGRQVLVSGWEIRRSWRIESNEEPRSLVEVARAPWWDYDHPMMMLLAPTGVKVCGCDFLVGSANLAVFFWQKNTMMFLERWTFFWGFFAQKKVRNLGQCFGAVCLSFKCRMKMDLNRVTVIT